MLITLFSQIHLGRKTSICYIDSSSLPACHIKRSRKHKTLKNIAQYGKSSIGWFFSLKLHIVINDRGQLIAFIISPGNLHDAKAGEALLETLQGLAFGDKGYIGKSLFERLLRRGLKLITRTRKNMKPTHVSALEKQLLNQRNMVETVFGQLKHRFQVWHTRHRSIVNALAHLMAAIAAYTLAPLDMAAIKQLTPSNFLTETPN
jgi:hypothetical protein